MGIYFLTLIDCCFENKQTNKQIDLVCFYIIREVNDVEGDNSYVYFGYYHLHNNLRHKDPHFVQKQKWRMSRKISSRCNLFYC